jgi:heme-degrading monooxygenase HmoA
MEVAMFARNVSVLLKPHTLGDFTQILKNEVLPIMREQPGFRDEIVFATADSHGGGGGTEIVEISLWDSKQDAENFVKTGYPEVLELVKPFFDATPRIRASTVINSTCHNRDEHPPRLRSEPVALEPLRSAGSSSKLIPQEVYKL